MPPLVAIDLIVPNENGDYLLGHRVNNPHRDSGSYRAAASARTNASTTRFARLQ
jgi:hypothetical protein